MYNNTSILNLNVGVYDDTVPNCTVSYVHAEYKYNLLTGISHEYTTPIYILLNNTTQNIDTPIVINRFDDIKFNLYFTKTCTCRIDYKKPNNISGIQHSANTSPDLITLDEA